MTHDDAKQLLRPLARADRAAPAVDVGAWVMRDVRAIARSRGPANDDAFIWRIAAACASGAAIAVVAIVAVALAAEENPLIELASLASGVVSEAR